MSASFSIVSSTGTYEVTVAQGLFAGAISHLGQSQALQQSQFLADEFFRPRLHGITPSPIFLPATEQEKSLERVPALIEQMRLAGVNRRTKLVAVGGGVIQDISAFAGSIYMRGLTWSYFPTTVLAMVDSCIGGKSSINVGPYKNLAGTFHPPSHIQIDPLLAQTLPSDQFASGLIEAAKICFCRGPESFSRYLSHHPTPGMSPEALEQVILESLLAKKHFIEIDEFDRKERLLLNFGHTFGHAIEGASHYAIPHGIAVGLGVLCSLHFQQQQGLSFKASPEVDLLGQHLDTLIRSLPDLATQLRLLTPADLLNRFQSDKKHTSTHFTLILVSASGEVVLERHPRTPETERNLQRAFDSVRETYTK